MVEENWESEESEESEAEEPEQEKEIIVDESAPLIE